MGITASKKNQILYFVVIVIGLLIAVGLIMMLNQNITLAACLEHGGRYVSEQGHCLDPVTGYKHPLDPTAFMLTGYGLILLITPLLFKRLLDSVIAWRAKKLQNK